jgi:hypothetical protein
MTNAHLSPLLTRHAQARCADRGIPLAVASRLIDHGRESAPKPDSVLIRLNY